MTNERLERGRGRAHQADGAERLADRLGPLPHADWIEAVAADEIDHAAYGEFQGSLGGEHGLGIAGPESGRKLDERGFDVGEGVSRGHWNE